MNTQGSWNQTMTTGLSVDFLLEPSNIVLYYPAEFVLATQF